MDLNLPSYDSSFSVEVVVLQLLALFSYSRLVLTNQFIPRLCSASCFPFAVSKSIQTENPDFSGCYGFLYKNLVCGIFPQKFVSSWIDRPRYQSCAPVSLLSKTALQAILASL